jgi:hypothetical protein
VKAKLAPISKAIAGGLVGALTFAIPVVDDGVQLVDALGIALAFIGGLGIVYAAPRNTDR